jgi:NADH-quinone oxidoreductase chain G
MSKTEAKPEVELATITVNGEEMQAPKGANLLQTLLDAGYDIPHYCYHPSLSIAGSCRLCFVQMEGDARLHVSCNMRVADGLKILTETETVLEARKGMMEFLLVNHPLDCPVCDKGGECMLQRYSVDHGLADARTVDQRRRFIKPQFDPLIDLERNRCILCSRCVRFCDEIGEKHVLGIIERGDRNRIGTFNDGPISSVYSGNIIDICPVGALTSKPFRFSARSWELQQVPATCVYCSSGCGITAWIRDGQVKRVTSPVVRKEEEYTLNEDTEDFICNQGRFGCDFGLSENRQLSPTLGKGEGRKEAGWPEALNAAASGIKRIAEEHGPDSVAFLAGPGSTNEELYLLQRLARQCIGTSNVDWRAQFADAAACEAASAALAAADGAIADLETVDTVLVVEANLLACSPIFALKVKEAAKHAKNKTALIGSIVDPLIAGYSKVNALVKIGDAPRVLDSLTAGSSEEFAELRELVSGAKTGLIIFGLSEQSGVGLPALVSAVHRLKNRLGAGWKTLPVAGERNAVGAFALGAQPERLPGAPCGDEGRQAKVSELWNTELPHKPGLTAPEIIAAAAEGKIKALYVLGQDGLRNAPDQALLAQALEKIEFLVVQDSFSGPASGQADVFLPSSLFYEADATLTDLEGALGLQTRANDPPQGVGVGYAILKSLAQLLGGAFNYASQEEVFREFLPLLGAVRHSGFGFSDLALDAPGPEWPLRASIKAKERVRPDFRIRFAEPARECGDSAQTPAAQEGKLAPRWSWDVTRPSQLGDNSLTMSKARGGARVSVNPADANTLGLSNGQTVSVKAEGAEAMQAELNVSDTVAPGVIYFAANDFPPWIGAPRIDFQCK